MNRLLTALLSIVTLSLVSCNNNDETPYETNLPIDCAYLPVEKTFPVTDKETLDKCRQLNNKTFIINSLNELPEDIFSFSGAYDKINFNNSTLFVTYRLHSWKIESYGNRWFRNNVEKTYNWTIMLGLTDVSDETPENVTFTRFAIEVPKLKENTDITVWYSLSDLEWEWE